MKPKLENGFIQIACGKPENDILTALASAGLNGNELSIVLLVIRKTWGWRKNWDHISVSQFAKITGITKRVVMKNISRLVLKRVLVSKKTLGKVSEYAFNERFAEWTGAKNITGAKNDTCAKTMYVTGAKTMSKLVLNLAPTKDNTKDNTKERKNNYIFDKNGNYQKPRKGGGIASIQEMLKKKGLYAHN